MGLDTAIYGHSRGYRILTVLSLAALTLSLVTFLNRPGFNPVAAVAIPAFALLTVHSLRRAVHRIAVLHITDTGFVFTDPAQTFGLVEFDEIEELRIYALPEKPLVGVRFVEPDHIRRRGPVVMRVLVKPIWRFRHYQIILQLDDLDDQVAAIKSVAVRVGIPVRSELL